MISLAKNKKIPIIATAKPPNSIPQWINQLDGPPAVFVPKNFFDNNGKLIRQDYVVDATEFNQQILPTVDENGNPTGIFSERAMGVINKHIPAVDIERNRQALEMAIKVERKSSSCW